jgi:hypothetical protein
MDGCCKELSNLISANEISLTYSKKERYYGINYKPRTGGGIQLIKFCPWCGSALQKDLIEEYASIVFDELGYDPLDINYKKKIPSEFKTDKWWKKRGL